MICPRCGRSFPAGGRCVCGYAQEPVPPESGPANPPSSLSELEKQLAELQNQLARLANRGRRLQSQVDELRWAQALAAPRERPAAVEAPPPTPPERPAPPLLPEEPPTPAPPLPSVTTPERPRPSKPVSSLFDSVGKRATASWTREWEVLVGGNWLLRVGVAAIVLGALYFLKYAFDNQWIGNTGRVLIGVFAGLGLLYGGEAFQRKGYRLYGQSLSGGGVAVLYLSIYAAFNFYSLIPQLAAFALMALVTLSCGALAHRHASKSLAVLGLLGGLLTPYWLRGTESQQVGLLTYLLILVVGFGVLAWRRGWLFLNWLSFLGTVVLFAGWAAEHYTSAALWTTQIFLTLFAAAYVVLGESGGRRAEGGIALRARQLAVAAVVFFFFSSVAVLSEEAAYFWSFLVLFSLLMLGYGLRRSSNLVNEGWLVLVGLGLLIWLTEVYGLADRALAWAGSLTLFAMALLQGILRQKLNVAPAGHGDFRLALAAGLGFYWVSYFLLSGSSSQYPSYSHWLGLLAIGQGIVHLVLSRMVLGVSTRGRLLILGHVAAAVTLAALAVPVQFDQNWVTIGWALEAVILAQIGFSVRWEKLRWAAALLLWLSFLRLIALDAWEPLEHYQLLLNRRAFTFLVVIAAIYLVSWIYHRQPDEAVEVLPKGGIVDGLLILAGMLTVFLLSQEIWSYFEDQLSALRLALDREAVTSAQFRQSLRDNQMGRQLGLSVVWAAYSVATCVAGLLRGRAALRLFGIGLFFITIVKVFWLDIWALQQFYRILSVIALGLFLLVVAFLYQRYRSRILGSEEGDGEGERST